MFPGEHFASLVIRRLMTVEKALTLIFLLVGVGFLAVGYVSPMPRKQTLLALGVVVLFLAAILILLLAGSGEFGPCSPCL
jgi:hypothetical protein